MTTHARRHQGRMIRRARRARLNAVLALARDITADTPPDKIVRTR